MSKSKKAAMEMDYYLLDTGELARIRHQAKSADGMDGEILGDDGRWRPHPIDDIRNGGMPIDTPLARRHAKDLGVNL